MKLPAKAIGLMAVFLSACSVGPEYQAPTVDLQNSFTAGGGSSVVGLEDHQWWKEFKNPVLNELVAQGRTSNLDLRASLARIEQAEAGLRATGLNSQTSGGLSASTTRSGVGSGAGVATNTVALTGSFLFDLFGGVRHGQEEALANLQAAEFSLGDARAAITLAIVTHYLNARFFQEAAELSRQTVSSRRATLRLAKDNFEVGTATDLEIAQVEAELLAAQADVQDYISGFESSTFAIATLLDSPPKPILQKLQPGGAQPRAPGATKLGVPADLVRNLPSIRTSERLYAASVAKLGVAEANLLPSLSLTGNLAISNTDTWSFGPTLSLPVFNQAVLTARRDAQIAAAKEAELAWRASVRSAIEKVETNSNSLIRSRRQIGFLQGAVAANARSASLSREQYVVGVVNRHARLTPVLG